MVELALIAEMRDRDLDAPLLSAVFEVGCGRNRGARLERPSRRAGQGRDALLDEHDLSGDV